MKAKKSITCLVAVALILMIGNSSFAQNSGKSTDWELFSKNLVRTLSTNHDGLQQSAMRLIIHFADSLEVQDGVFDIMRIFRFSEDPRVRQLALVTLYRIGDEYAMDFVKRNLKFEKDEKIIRLSRACIIHHYNLMTPLETEYASY